MAFVQQLLKRSKNDLRVLAKGSVPAVRKIKHAALTRWFQLNNPAHGAAPKGVEWHVAETKSDASSFAGVKPKMELIWKGAQCGPELRPFFPETVNLSLPEERVGEFKGAQFVGVRSSVGIGPAFIDSDNRLISDYSYDPFGLENHVIFSKLRLPRERKIRGLSALLHTPQCDDNYYAFTLELLPKLHLMALAGYPMEKFDHFIINRCAHSFQTELLRMAGVPQEKLVMTDADYNFSLERVVVTAITNTEKGFAPWRLDYLRSLVGEALVKPSRRIFITRRTASNRRLLNEEELMTRLGPLGFEIIDCGKFTVLEQARIFQEAAVIVAVHGAGLTNLIHCAPGIRLIEIVNVMSPTLYFNSISTLLNLDHEIINGYPDSTDPKLEQHRMHREDYRVKVDDVIRALGNL